MNSFSKEMQIRRRIAGIFNKREEDFESLREYNDYLEEVEDMTCNLIDGVNVPAIEEKIARYQEENAEQIMIAKARKAEEMAAAASKGQIKAQGDTDMSANNSFQAGLVVGQQGQYAPTIAGGQPRPTGMAPQPVPIGGGMDMLGYSMEDEETMRLRAERGSRAGGWSIELSKKRAFEEAFASIWV
ncbi:unnamed protein product [Rhodiola kirilowii]